MPIPVELTQEIELDDTEVSLAYFCVEDIVHMEEYYSSPLILGLMDKWKNCLQIVDTADSQLILEYNDQKHMFYLVAEVYSDIRGIHRFLLQEISTPYEFEMWSEQLLRTELAYDCVEEQFKDLPEDTAELAIYLINNAIRHNAYTSEEYTETLTRVIQSVYSFFSQED